MRAVIKRFNLLIGQQQRTIKNALGIGDDHIKLPLLISVPHGGHSVPNILHSHLVLDQHDIFPDSDPYTRQIYAFKDEVYYYHDTDIARAVVDLNREKGDLPPRNPDGVIKSHTVLGKKVYGNSRSPDKKMIQDLLEKFYFPYHLNIQQSMEDTSLLCGIDCHSMLEFLPEVKSIKENERPFICLSNGGDENGEGDETNLTCHPDLINMLADCLCSEFPDEADNIILNTPFKGGHISRYHSKKIPWIQIELNRRAYLRSPWFNPKSLKVERGRLEYLRTQLLRAFISFCDEAGSMQYMHSINNLRSNASQVPFNT